MVTLNVGQDFKKRWLNTPEAVREAFVDDLSRICDLLTPESNIQAWLTNDQHALQVAQLKIEQAYADLKAKLIEEARVRKQIALEKSLAQKRTLQQQYNQQLQLDEIQQYHAQTISLAALQKNLDDEIVKNSERYSKNPKEVSNKSPNGRFNIQDEQIISELESLRLRLELEAETLIEESVATFREKLNIAAEDEIGYILEKSNFSAKK